MRNGWGTWISGVVLGAAAGFVCGQIAGWTRAESRAHDHQAEFHADIARDDLSAVADHHDGLVYFPDQVAPSGRHDDPEMMHADAVLETGAEQSSAGREPAALPAPADAAPLSDQSQQTLRAVLDSELAELSPADRDIWLEALDGLSAADAVGIVRIWKKFGGGPGLLSEAHRPDSLPRTGSPTILIPTPNSPPPVSDGQTLETGERSSRTNLHETRQFVIHNLLSAETFGYRRLEPLFGATTPGAAVVGATGSAGALVGTDADSSGAPMLMMVGARTDHTTGEFVETSSPLDLAIEGDGFFAVTAGEQTFFTRCGRFSRDANGRLVLKTARGELAVDPELTIPDDCAGLTVSIDGEVSVTRDGGPSESIGKLALALFVAPAELAVRNDALLSATERSGAPQFGRPNNGLRGGIHQRRLERSNVDVATETALLRQIDEWLELIEESKVVKRGNTELR